MRKTRVLTAAMAVVCLLGLTVQATAQGGGNNDRSDRPKLHWKDLNFEAGETPLQNAIKNARGNLLNGRKNKMSGDKLEQCQRALDSGNAKQISKFCEVPDLLTEHLGSGRIKDGNGKALGRRNVTETTLLYDEPKQHGKPGQPEQTSWDPLAIRGKKWGGGDHPGVANASGPNGSKGRSGQLSRGRAVLPESWMNTDHDCIDGVTGEHLRDGQCYQTDAGGALLEDASGNHDLLQTLLYGADAQCPDPGTGPEQCCRHAGTGTLFFGDPADAVPDECWDESGAPIGTTLQELINEDGPEDVDNDGRPV
jgi:hypothetical protein